MTFVVENEIKIDATKLTIDEQLDLCRLLVKAEYTVDRQYRTKDKNGAVRTFVTIGNRGLQGGKRS